MVGSYWWNAGNDYGDDPALTDTSTDNTLRFTWEDNAGGSLEVDFTNAYDDNVHTFLSVVHQPRLETETVAGVKDNGTTTVTASDDSFVAGDVGSYIYIEGIGSFLISGYTSATEITVDGDATCPGNNFVVYDESDNKAYGYVDGANQDTENSWRLLLSDANETFIRLGDMSTDSTGLVDSASGPRGGFLLNAPANDIALLQIYEAIDGKLDEGGCLLGEPICIGGKCLLGEMLHSLHEQLRDYLNDTTLAKLAESLPFNKKLPTADTNGAPTS